MLRACFCQGYIRVLIDVKNEKFEILGRHTSYNVQKVLWLADELGIQYKHTQIGGKYGGTDDQSFSELNPHQKVPVLIHEQTIVWESNTILRYLAELFDSSSSEIGWYGASAYQRSLVSRWMDWSIDRLESDFVGVFWGYYRTPEQDRDLKAIADSIEKYENSMRILSLQLAKNNFLLGEAISLADVVTGVFIHRLYVLNLDINFPENIQKWYERLTQRESYSKWVMSDFSELKGRSVY